MKIQYCSDLHIEFPFNKTHLALHPITPAGDILLLAGDVMLFTEIDKHHDFLAWVSDHFRETYWVPGNHEYYGSDLSEQSLRLHEKLLPNVNLVNNVTIQLEDIELVFSTLWSKINLEKEYSIKRTMADFHLIRKHGSKITVTDYMELHETCLAFLRDTLEQPVLGKRLVVTHHLPTYLNYPPRYLGSDLNSAFATELSDLVTLSGAAYWIFGHHHQPVPDFAIGNTLLTNNQLGYVQYGEHSNFSPEKLLKF
jgi:predicted phosphohydrolase